MGRLDRWLRILPLRLRSLFRRDRVEQELADELEFHIVQETARHLARGLSPEQAREAARRGNYGIEALKDACRDARGIHWIDSVVGDTRYTLRTLRRSPGFTVFAVLTLAIGIGVNTAVFTVSSANLFRGFRTIDRNDRILYIHTNKNGQYSGVSYPDVQDWSQAKSFTGVGAIADLQIRCDQDGIAQLCSATRATANAFHLLGQQPMLGRNFVASDEAPGAAPVALLSYGFWERRFGKDPAIVGKTLSLGVVDQTIQNGDGRPNTITAGTLPTDIIGVMPKGFAFPQNQDLWVPLTPTAALQPRDARSIWFAFGRLADGVSRAVARAELEAIGSRLARAYPQTNQGQIPVLENFTEFFTAPGATVLYEVMWGAVGFVLLIACADLANLLLARAAGRSREMSIRAALGAGRWRIVRQLLIESLVLSILGGACGWAIARWSVRAYKVATNPPVGDWNRNLLDYSMDLSVLAYLIAISMGAGVLFGLAPTLRFSRPNVNAVLKDRGAGASGGRRGRRVSGLLVAGEAALAIVLLAGAGVMMHSFLTMYTADIGATTTTIATMGLRLPKTKYSTRERQVSFYDRLKTRVEALPGIESMAIGQAPASTCRRCGGSTPYEIADGPPVDEGHRPNTAAKVIGPDYFRVLGATVLSGREFNNADGSSTLPVAIVNQRFAAQHWPGRSAIGQRVRLQGKTPSAWLTIVGVVSNVVYDQLRQQITLVVYLPYAQTNTGDQGVLVRTAVPVDTVIASLRSEVNAVDRDVIVSGPYDLADRLATIGDYGRARNNTALLLICAVIALLLASGGLYTVVAHSVTQRTQEIGVRIAIGATTRDVMALVFTQGMRPVGVGLAIGLVASFAVTPVLQSQLVGVSPTDPLSLIVASVTLVLAAMLGCLLPARQAMRVDPLVALRHD